MATKRKFPKDTLRIQFDARIPLAEIGEALIVKGIHLKQNPESLDLYAVRGPKPIDPKAGA